MSHTTNLAASPLLDRVAVHAAEQASLSLTRWLGRNVHVHADGFASASLAEAANVIGGGEEAVVAVHTLMEGAITGHVLLAFPERVASQLVCILTGDPEVTPAQFDDMAKSAMAETGNIVSSTFLNALSVALGVRAQPSAPIYLHDIGGALIEPLVAEQAENSPSVLYIQARLEVQDLSLECWLYVMPALECIQVMTALLH